MVHAFVMIKTEAGEGERLLDAIRQVVSVSEAHIVAGNYDIIAEMDTEEVYDVLKSVSGDVQGLQGVTDTRTYISMDG
jgi:DNA-binding Lrp family transcriptional regulator